MKDRMADRAFHRVLGRFDALALAFGAMIGWGWVILAGAWVAEGGMLGAALAFLAGGGAICLIGLTYGELASALPFAGGEHVYTERAFGGAASFLCTWSIIFGYVTVVAFEAIALPVAVAALVPDFRQYPLWTIAGYEVHGTEALFGAAAAALIAYLNVRGVRVAARVQAVAVSFILLAGVLLIAAGVLSLGSQVHPVTLWKDREGFISVLIMVPFLFVGFDVIPQSAEEIKTSKRTIGRTLVGSIFFAVLFYVLVVVAVGLAPVAADGGGLVTAEAVGAAFHAPAAAQFVVLAGIGGILTSWNAFLIGGSRALYALARAGHLPAFLGRLHRHYGTPWGAVAVIGALTVLAPLLGRSALVWMVTAGGFGIVVAYVFVAAAFLTLRRREPDLDRPYRAPGGRVTGLLALLLALALAALYLPGSPSGLIWPQEWGLVLIWFVAGLGLVAATRLARRFLK